MVTTMPNRWWLPAKLSNLTGVSRAKIYYLYSQPCFSDKFCEPGKSDDRSGAFGFRLAAIRKKKSENRNLLIILP
jgi:hypothetical protein